MSRPRTVEDHLEPSLFVEERVSFVPGLMGAAMGLIQLVFLVCFLRKRL